MRGKSILVALVLTLAMTGNNAVSFFTEPETEPAATEAPESEEAEAETGLSLAETEEAEVEPEITQEEPAESEEVPAPSLWGAVVSLSTHQVSFPALGEEDQIRAMSPDGTKVLVDHRSGVPALLDLETGELLKISLSDWTRELLINLPVGMEKAKSDPHPEKMSDEELLAFCLTDERTPAYFSGYVSTVEGPFLSLVDFYGRFWALDCETGLLYGPFHSAVSYSEGSFLDLQLVGPLNQIDQETGAVTAVEMEMPEDWTEGSAVMAARFTGDGGICALASRLPLDAEEGNDYYFFRQNSEGELLTCELGRFLFNQAPNAILATKEDQYLLYNQSTPAGRSILSVNGKNGEVRMLSLENNELTLLEMTEETEAVRGGFIPLLRMADGNTVFIQMMPSGDYALLKPETGEVQALKGLFFKTHTGSMIISMTGNGYDRFFIRTMTGTEEVKSYTTVNPLN